MASTIDTPFSSPRTDGIADGPTSASTMRAAASQDRRTRPVPPLLFPMQAPANESTAKSAKASTEASVAAEVAAQELAHAISAIDSTMLELDEEVLAHNFEQRRTDGSYTEFAGSGESISTVASRSFSDIVVEQEAQAQMDLQAAEETLSATLIDEDIQQKDMTASHERGQADTHDEANAELREDSPPAEASSEAGTVSEHLQSCAAAATSLLDVSSRDSDHGSPTQPPSADAVDCIEGQAAGISRELTVEIVQDPVREASKAASMLSDVTTPCSSLSPEMGRIIPGKQIRSPQSAGMGASQLLEEALADLGPDQMVALSEQTCAFIDDMHASEMNSVREKAGLALIEAARDGSLDKALGDVRQSSVDSLRTQAGLAFAKAVREGSLAEEISAAQQSALDSVRVKAGKALIKAIRDGSLAKEIGEVCQSSARQDPEGAPVSEPMLPDGFSAWAFLESAESLTSGAETAEEKLRGDPAEREDPEEVPASEQEKPVGFSAWAFLESAESLTSEAATAEERETEKARGKEEIAESTSLIQGEVVGSSSDLAEKEDEAEEEKAGEFVLASADTRRCCADFWLSLYEQFKSEHQLTLAREVVPLEAGKPSEDLLARHSATRDVSSRPSEELDPIPSASTVLPPSFAEFSAREALIFCQDFSPLMFSPLSLASPESVQEEPPDVPSWYVDSQPSSQLNEEPVEKEVRSEDNEMLQEAVSVSMVGTAEQEPPPQEVPVTWAYLESADTPRDEAVSQEALSSAEKTDEKEGMDEQPEAASKQPSPEELTEKEPEDSPEDVVLISPPEQSNPEDAVFTPPRVQRPPSECLTPPVLANPEAPEHLSTSPRKPVQAEEAADETEPAARQASSSSEETVGQLAAKFRQYELEAEQGLPIQQKPAALRASDLPEACPTEEPALEDEVALGETATEDKVLQQGYDAWAASVFRSLAEETLHGPCGRTSACKSLSPSDIARAFDLAPKLSSRSGSQDSLELRKTPSAGLRITPGRSTNSQAVVAAMHCRSAVPRLDMSKVELDDDDDSDDSSVISRRSIRFATKKATVPQLNMSSLQGATGLFDGASNSTTQIHSQSPSLKSFIFPASPDEQLMEELSKTDPLPEVSLEGTPPRSAQDVNDEKKDSEVYCSGRQTQPSPGVRLMPVKDGQSQTPSPGKSQDKAISPYRRKQIKPKLPTVAPSDVPAAVHKLRGSIGSDRMNCQSSWSFDVTGCVLANRRAPLKSTGAALANRKTPLQSPAVAPLQSAGSFLANQKAALQSVAVGQPTSKFNQYELEAARGLPIQQKPVAQLPLARVRDLPEVQLQRKRLERSNSDVVTHVHYHLHLHWHVKRRDNPLSIRSASVPCIRSSIQSGHSALGMKVRFAGVTH